MPIYSYKCENKACNHELEALQKMSEEPLKICPICHKEELVKQLTSSAFHLKGGGWYQTDFKKK